MSETPSTHCMFSAPTVTLSSGFDMPVLGLGTYKSHDAVEVMLKALDMGYRLLDTAWIYGNEQEVGEALSQSDIPRKDMFIATKIWPNYFSPDLAKRSIERSLNDLKLDYLDLMYLHWWGEDALDAWKVLEDYHDQGIIRSLGVSNFTASMIDELARHARIMPACDQIEIHPLWPELELVDYLKQQKIQPVAYCPIARAKQELMQSNEVLSCADKYHKSPAQIVLRWQIDRGIAVIPKTVHEKRLPENIDVFDFRLTTEEVRALSQLGQKDGKISRQMDDASWLRSCAEQAL